MDGWIYLSYYATVRHTLLVGLNKQWQLVCDYHAKCREVPMVLWSVLGVGVQWISNLHLLHFFHLPAITTNLTAVTDKPETSQHRQTHHNPYSSDRQTRNLIAPTDPPLTSRQWQTNQKPHSTNRPITNQTAVTDKPETSQHRQTHHKPHNSDRQTRNLIAPTDPSQTTRQWQTNQKPHSTDRPTTNLTTVTDQSQTKDTISVYSVIT